jgi:protein gp37
MADRGFSPFAMIHMNVLVGCMLVSDGCKHCWAAHCVSRMKDAKLYKGLLKFTNTNGWTWTGKQIFVPKALKVASRYKNRNIWVAPHSDVFLESTSLETIALIYATFYENPSNNFFVLTKRIERMHQLCTDGTLHKEVEKVLGRTVVWPPPNVMDGVSIESERTAQARLPVLRDMPSPYRVISAQPLLKHVNFSPWISDGKVRLVLMGPEAGPMSRETDWPVLADVESQLVRSRVPHLTMCYPV